MLGREVRQEKIDIQASEVEKKLLQMIKYQVKAGQKVVKSKLAEKLGISLWKFHNRYGDFVEQATHNLGGICQ